MMRPDIAVATHRDVPEMAQTLALAFADDPAFSWILPDPAVRQARLPGLFALMAQLGLQKGVALRAADGMAATLWRAPGRAQDGPLTMLRHVVPLVSALRTALPRALAVASAIERHHPVSGKGWYLHMAGVRPEAQGKGLGGAAIRVGLALANAQGLPVFLETATARNVSLYAALGFRVTAEWDVPGGGPHFWTMERPPAAP